MRLRPLLADVDSAHPIPGAGRGDFAGIARAAGIANAFSFDDIDEFADKLPVLMKMKGPVFVDLKVFPGDAYEYRWDVIHGPESRAAFREAIGRV